MNKSSVHILFIEDDDVDRMAVERFIKKEKLPYDLTFAKTVAEAKKQLLEGEFDLLLVDYNLPDGTGLDVHQEAVGIPSIFLTGVSEVSLAVEAMQAGAYSYLIKDLDREYLTLLHVTIKRALRRKREEDELEHYRLHLEEEVNLRTVELREAIDQLRSEITERIEAEENLQKYIQRLDALRNIDQAISGSLDLKITMDILLSHLLAQLEVDAAVVLIYKEDIQTLQFVHQKGFNTTALQHTNPRLGEGYAGKVGLEKEHIYFPDLNKTDHRFRESAQFIKEEFVAYYGVPLIAKGLLVGVLEIFHRSPLDLDTKWKDFLVNLSNQAAIAIDNITLFNDLQRSNMDLTIAYDNTIEGWAQALELRDMETEGHSRRVVDLSMQLARRLGISDKNLVHLRRGALLHDIGKMGVPDSILQKPGKLTEEEWQIMQQHPVFAYQWLSSIEYLRPALDIPYYHHERWDGSGYPHGLSGEQIPLMARLFAIVDVWDALLSDRPYRKVWSKKKTIKHIKEQSGKHFDPEVVETFLKIVDVD